MKAKKIISMILRIVVAVIFIQTLFFKFTAHPDSVELFTALGVEPFGRIGLGIVELIVSLLILIPKTKALGIVSSIGIMIGAIGSHFLVIGTNFKGDGGALFAMAVVVFIAATILFFMHKDEVKSLIKFK